MKVAGLTKADKVVLAELYESTAYQSLKKVLAARQMVLAQTAVGIAQSMEDVKYARGGIQELKTLEDFLRSNHKEQGTSTDSV